MPVLGGNLRLYLHGVSLSFSQQICILMKNLYASTLLVFLLLCGLTATAQTHRQALRTVKGKIGRAHV